MAATVVVSNNYEFVAAVIWQKFKNSALARCTDLQEKRGRLGCVNPASLLPLAASGNLDFNFSCMGVCEKERERPYKRLHRPTRQGHRDRIWMRARAGVNPFAFSVASDTTVNHADRSAGSESQGGNYLLMDPALGMEGRKQTLVTSGGCNWAYK